MSFILVTNDDGLHAPGIAHLANAAVAAGHDVVAVAPEENMSGSAAAIGAGMAPFAMAPSARAPSAEKATRVLPRANPPDFHPP